MYRSVLTLLTQQPKSNELRWSPKTLMRREKCDELPLCCGKRDQTKSVRYCRNHSMNGFSRTALTSVNSPVINPSAAAQRRTRF